MLKRSLTFRTLGLFTSAEQAEAIEGDLIEEHPDTGRVRHLFRVLRIVLALAVGSVRSAPFRVAFLCFASLIAIVLASSIVLTVVQAWPPGALHLPWHLPAIMLLSFLCGMRLAHVGRELGVSAACLTFVVVTGTVTVVGIYLVGAWFIDFRASAQAAGYPFRGTDVVLYAFIDKLRLNLLYPLCATTVIFSGPLVLGSFAQRQRMLGASIRSRELL